MLVTVVTVAPATVAVTVPETGTVVVTAVPVPKESIVILWRFALSTTACDSINLTIRRK